MRARLATFLAAIATAAAIVAVTLISTHPAAQSAVSAPTAIPSAVPGEGSWAAAAAALPVTDSADVPQYESESFGERGADVDGNGCAQRDDVLARDLADIVREDCKVVSGTLRDPYTGRKIPFSSKRDAAGDNAQSPGIRVDRIVGLRAAHDGGAWKWTPERRQAFAGSLENMLAVDGETAQEKAGRGPARWLPSDDDFVCEYAIRYTWIASAWQLAVPRTDRNALISTLSDCER